MLLDQAIAASSLIAGGGATDPALSDLIIRVLTTLSLAGLLLAVGLRLKLSEVHEALQRSHPFRLLLVNFVLVPLFTLGCIRGLQIPSPIALGMLVLAASPFAPVVPVFTRMARADLALAAGLTAVVPVASSFLSPWICGLSLQALPEVDTLEFSVLTILGVLLATITLPLVIGLAVRRQWPEFATRVLRPMEIFSEAVGTVSLAFVTAVEFNTILQTGWKPLLLMTVVFELSLVAGFLAGGPSQGTRRVTAMGASNRNIALGILIAIGSFAGTPVVGAVVANGLLMILLGLLHVAWWRFGPNAGQEINAKSG